MYIFKFWSSFEKRYCLVHFWKEIHDSWKCCTHVWSMFDVSRSAWWVQEYIIDQNNDVKTESRASCRKWTKSSKAPPKMDRSEALGRLLACLRNHLVDTFQVRRHHCHHNNLLCETWCESAVKNEVDRVSPIKKHSSCRCNTDVCKNLLQVLC